MTRQRLGQHFLRDRRTASRIAAALPDRPPRVIEIGPGRGALTEPLLDRFETVLAVELDARLAADLPRRLSRPDGLRLVEADAVEADLDALAGGERWLVAGNLPYQVGTAIVRRLLPRADLFPAVVVMLQREVVDRLLAGAGDPARGLLSVEAELYAERTLLFTVGPGAFAPPPKVDSAVIRLDLHPPTAPPEVVETALRLAGAAFMRRRKTLANGLASVLATPARTAAAAGVDPSRRPQTVTAADWIALARAAMEEGT